MSIRYLLPILTLFYFFNLSQPTAMFAAAPTPTPVVTLQIQPIPPQAEPGQPINVTLSQLPETVIKGQEMACVSLQTADGFEVAGSDVKLIVTDNSYFSHLETSPHMTAGRYQLVVTICGSGEGYPSSQVGSTIFAQSYTITASTGQFDEVQQIISPDNQWTAIVNLTQGSLDLVSSTGQTQTMFAAGSTVDSVNWSPNSDELLVVLTHRIYLQPLGSGVISNKPLELWGIRFQNNQPDKPRLLFSSPDFNPDMAEQLIFGTWSPNGQHLLFWVSMLSASVTLDGVTPYMLDLNSQKVTRIADVSLLNEDYRSWSPDSSQLAITVGAGREAWLNKWLMLYDTRTATATMLISTTEQIPGAVAWSPDGETLAYTAISPKDAQKATGSNGFDNPGINQRRIYLLDMTTKEYRRLNSVDKFQDRPTWGIDGTLYYVQQLTPNDFALMSLDNMGQTAEIKTHHEEGDIAMYYASSSWDDLLPVLPIDPRLHVLTTTTPTNEEIVRFIFTKHPPEWNEIWQHLTDVNYVDFTRHEADVVGDEQKELIFTGKVAQLKVYLAILTRPKEQAAWQIAFYTEEPNHYAGDVAVKIDGQQLTVDFLTSTGGTGIFEMTWQQHWVDCATAKGCQEIWHAPLLHAWRNENFNIEQGYEVSQITRPESDTLKVTTERFSVSTRPTLYGNPTLYYFTSALDYAHLVSGPNSTDSYEKDANGTFTLISHEQLNQGRQLNRLFDLATEETIKWLYASNITQSINFSPTATAKDDTYWGVINREPDGAIHNGTLQQEPTWVAGFIGSTDAPRCLLTVQHITNKSFKFMGQVEIPCISNFSQLSQADVDGDGKAELLFLTLHPELDDISEIQTLHVYHVGTELTEMTTLTGTINGSDGVGIRWEKDATGKLTFLTGLPLAKWQGCSEKMLTCVTTERRFERYEWQK